MISNRTRAARLFDFEIKRMISDQISLHSVQLPLLHKFLTLSDTTTVKIFQIFVYGHVVYAQTWEVLTLKNCIEPP